MLVHTLMKLMGHSSIATTQKYYLRSSDANEKKAVDVLERISVETFLIISSSLIVMFHYDVASQ